VLATPNRALQHPFQHLSLHTSCPILAQGIPLNEQKRLANVAVDAVFDSVSIATTFREELSKAGVIFCSISEAVKEYPDLVRKHMGSVVSSFWEE
jgi:Fe-S cluster assembly scaffold protein SufB